MIRLENIETILNIYCRPEVDDDDPPRNFVLNLFNENELIWNIHNNTINNDNNDVIFNITINLMIILM